MKKTASTLTIPNDTAYLPVIAAYMQAVASRHGFGSADADLILLAVDEACTHVIETAFDPGDEQTFTVACEAISSGLTITIADMGMPFDPDSIKPYDHHGGLERDMSGLPFYLIRQAVDEVRFVNKGRNGKEIQLVKRLPARHVESHFNRQEFHTHDDKPRQSPPEGYDYRLMEPSDAIEVAKCVYKTYGYTYVSEHIYFPERLVAMNRSGELISAVAVTRGGEVVGHCALEGQPGCPVMEMGEAVVAPAHRGRRVMEYLTQLLMTEAHQREVRGLLTTPVTLHPFSQRAVLKFHFRESAVLLAYLPRSLQFKLIGDAQPAQRESLLYCYKQIQNDSGGRVFPPAHHYEMIARIYRNLELDRELIPPDDLSANPAFESSTPDPSRFVLATHVKPYMALAQLELHGYGPVIEQQVKKAMEDLCCRGIAAVQLDLPLHDAHTPMACRRFEEMGFFFAGIIPRPANGGDCLRLQYLNNLRIDYERLKVFSDFAKKLVGYVQACDPGA